jgi:hypothetical protein
MSYSLAFDVDPEGIDVTFEACVLTVRAKHVDRQLPVYINVTVR